MKAHEILAAADASLVGGMLDWFRSNDRNVYRSAVSTLAGNRKLRPVFIEKKPLAEQYAWIHKTLGLRACDSIAEQILQAYLMAGQQSMLVMFCDGMGIPHDGKGAVIGNLPKDLDPERLATTIERLVEIFDPRLVTLYLRCFNLQVAGGWAVLTETLSADGRLKLS